MNSRPIRPGRLARDADGTPCSPEHGDLYHPRSGALAQARHVFLGGNELPARWRGRDRFTVLEIGFGLGNNFLATRAAWQADAERPARLHFVSIEAEPLERGVLAALEREPSLEPLAAELAAAWPPLTFNLHRLDFDGGAVQLSLAFGDAAAWLPQLVAEVDAFYLDGFAPARNPSAWEPRLFKAMARLAAPGATAASWTAARAVRDGLAGAGFEVALAPGQGGKRDITRARFAPRFVPKPSPRRTRRMSATTKAASPGSDPVVVVGAGLAGCAVAHALAVLGRSSIVVERGGAIAEAGSGNPAGIFHGVVHRVDGRHARFFRAAALAARTAIGAAVAEGVPGSTAGLLRLEPAAADAAELAATIARLGLPDDYVRAIDRGAASALAGTVVAAPAWFFPGGGWVAPRALCAWWLARAGARATLRLGTGIAAIERSGDGWALLGDRGSVLLRARTVVLAHAGAPLAVDGLAPWPLEASRGQLSSIDAAAWAGAGLPRLPVAGAGYVLPPLAGRVWFGAASQRGDDEQAVRSTDRFDNLLRARRVLPAFPDAPGSVIDRVGFRASAPDRLPLVGALPDGAAACASAIDRVHLVPRLPGLHALLGLGSRGIAVAALGSRVVAAAITGAPAPLEADLLDAIDPARFGVRAVRRAASGGAGDEAALGLQPPVGPAAGSAGG